MRDRDDDDDKQRAIYRERADAYDRLVRAEDVDGALGRALGALLARNEPRGLRALDVGCGTGRVAGVLLSLGVAEVVGVEREPAMLAVAARNHADAVARGALRLIEGDARALPLDDGDLPFDLAVAGWCFGHFRHWMPDGWRREIDLALDGLTRAVRPGGALVVIETLGTGHATPRAHPALDEYFEHLEARGFSRRWLRTDYAFGSIDEAAEVLGAFFPAALVAQIRHERWARVPECTGIWSRPR